MLILARFLIFLVLASVGVCFALYIATKNPRYLSFAWSVIKFTGVFLMVLAAFYLVERLILII